MFTLLSPPFNQKKIYLNRVKLNYLTQRFTQNYERVQTYLRQSSIFASSDHLLAKLLSSISISMNQTINDYYDDIDDSQFYYAQIHRIASDRQKANGVRNGSFFGGDNSIEIYVLDNSDFDIHQNWRDLRPCRLLQGDIIDFNLSYPDGNNLSDSATNVSIISINIKMLAVQYYQYLISDTDMFDGNVKRNMGSFLIRYPLANMLPSIVDVSFYNSFKAKLGIGYQTGFKSRNMSIALVNMETYFDSFIDESIRTLKLNPRLNWDDIITLLPTINSGNVLTMSHHGYQIYSQHNLWLFAYLAYEFYTTAMMLSPRTDINRGIFSDIVKNTRIINNGKYLYQGDKILASVTEENMNQLVNFILKETHSSHISLECAKSPTPSLQSYSIKPLLYPLLQTLKPTIT